MSCVQEPLVIRRRGWLGDLNENTLAVITDASRPVRKLVACVSDVSEGVQVTVFFFNKI